MRHGHSQREQRRENGRQVTANAYTARYAKRVKGEGVALLLRAFMAEDDAEADSLLDKADAMFEKAHSARMGWTAETGLPWQWDS